LILAIPIAYFRRNTAGFICLNRPFEEDWESPQP
jgi:hypothetical protein